MDEAITIRRTSDEDGEHSRWALIVGSESLVEILTAPTLPKAKAVEYLFRELVGRA